MIHGTIDDKFQHALREIEDNLISDEACFEWLLSQEELFTNEQWLNCIQIHSSKFISIKVMKMLLDVLYLLHCYDVGQEGVHKDIYNSLIKVCVHFNYDVYTSIHVCVFVNYENLTCITM